jgi:hypothetical protein
MMGVMNSYQKIASIALILFAFVSMTVEAENLYRYRNKEGNLVIDYAVPPAYVANGYEILSELGRVLEVVEPQQISEESEEVQQSRAKQAALQEQEDQMLLRTYSEVRELESAMERKLAQLDRETEIIQSNLEKNELALSASREQAANYQFGGRPIPKSLLKNMDEQIHERRDGGQMLIVRKQEHQGTKDRYLGYLDRFKELKGLKKSPATP